LSFASSNRIIKRLPRSKAAQAIEPAGYAAPNRQRKLAQSAELQFDRDQDLPQLQQNSIIFHSLQWIIAKRAGCNKGMPAFRHGRPPKATLS
jgi:hypothetical protein